MVNISEEGILLAQGGKELCIDGLVIAGFVRHQRDYGGKEGRLRAAEVIGAIAVRDVAVALDQARVWRAYWPTCTGEEQVKWLEGVEEYVAEEEN